MITGNFVHLDSKRLQDTATEKVNYWTPDNDNNDRLTFVSLTAKMTDLAEIGVWTN